MIEDAAIKLLKVNFKQICQIHRLMSFARAKVSKETIFTSEFQSNIKITECSTLFHIKQFIEIDLFVD